MTILNDKIRALVDAPNFAYLGVLDRTGAPHVSPVWIDRDGDTILINTAEGRLKTRAVERDPRVSVALVSGDDPYMNATIRGRVVEVRRDGAAEHIDALARKYRGLERYPGPRDDRVILLIEPHHVGGRAAG